MEHIHSRSRAQPSPAFLLFVSAQAHIGSAAGLPSTPPKRKKSQNSLLMCPVPLLVWARGVHGWHSLFCAQHPKVRAPLGAAHLPVRWAPTGLQRGALGPALSHLQRGEHTETQPWSSCPASWGQPASHPHSMHLETFYNFTHP